VDPGEPPLVSDQAGRPKPLRTKTCSYSATHSHPRGRTNIGQERSSTAVVGLPVPHHQRQRGCHDRVLALARVVVTVGSPPGEQSSGTGYRIATAFRSTLRPHAIARASPVHGVEILPDEELGHTPRIPRARLKSQLFRTQQADERSSRPDLPHRSTEVVSVRPC